MVTLFGALACLIVYGILGVYSVHFWEDLAEGIKTRYLRITFRVLTLFLWPLVWAVLILVTVLGVLGVGTFELIQRLIK